MIAVESTNRHGCASREGDVVEGITYPCFRVEQDRLGLWRWTYYHDEGKPLAMSFAGHASERDCRRAIELIGHCGQAHIFIKEPGDTGRWLRPDFELHSELVRSEPIRAQPIPIRSEPTRSEPTRSEPTRSEPTRGPPYGAPPTQWDWDY